MKIEKKLNRLFDYQRFEKNDRLEKLIQETESQFRMELSDESLELVSAAGDPRLNGEMAQEEEKGDKPKTYDPKYGSDLPTFEAPQQEWNL